MIARANFIAKLGIVEEECDQSGYWMQLIGALKLIKGERLAGLQTEAEELLALIVASINTARRAGRT